MSGFDVCEECKEGPQLLCPQCWKCKKKCCKCWDKPEVEEKMTEEEKELQEVDEWFRREGFHLWRDKSSLEIAKEAYLKGKEASQQKMREETASIKEHLEREKHFRKEVEEEIERLKKDKEQAEEKVKQLESERDNWIETARQHCENEAFYRDLLDEVAKHLGKGVFVSDDDNIQDSPIRVKIPEIVQKMREEMERLEVERDNSSSTIEMYQATLKECEEKVSQVESKSEELQKSFETAIDGYGKAAEKVEQLESELASLNGHCLIMYQEGVHKHDLMEEWHQKTLKLEEWQERSMKDYMELHVKYKQLESELAHLRGESLDAGGESLARGRRHFPSMPE